MVRLMLEKQEAVGKAFKCGIGKAIRIDELVQMISTVKTSRPNTSPNNLAISRTMMQMSHRLKSPRGIFLKYPYRMT